MPPGGRTTCSRIYNLWHGERNFSRLPLFVQLYGTNLKCYLINPSGMGIFRGFSFRSTTKTDMPVSPYLCTYVCVHVCWHLSTPRTTRDGNRCVCSTPAISTACPLVEPRPSQKRLDCNEPHLTPLGWLLCKEARRKSTAG